MLPHAELHREMKEFAGDVTPMMAVVAAARHSRASRRAGRHERPGGVDSLRHRRASFSPDAISRRIGFGQRVIPLTFTITLEDFQVPRDEGTDTPSNYISYVRFDDPATGRVGARHGAHEFARDVSRRFLALAARLELQVLAGELEPATT